MIAIHNAVRQYLRFLQAEENRSPLTVQNYKESLNLFQDLCPVVNLNQINKESVREYKKELHEFRAKDGEELSVGTKNHHLTVLRSFLRYLIQEEDLNVYPPDKIRLLKEAQRKVNFLDIEEMKQLMSAPDNFTKMGLRDQAILHMFFSTGLRRAELCSLNRKDVNLKTREMSVRGKRGKIRLVFMSEMAAQAIERYLKTRTDQLYPLFVRKGNVLRVSPPGEQYRLSSTSIYMIVKKYARQAGIVKNPSPHTLRHTFATDLLRNGADLRSVQELLGHSHLSTTQIYTHVTNRQLKEVHRKYHGKS